MTISVRIQESLLDFLEDGNPRSVQEMKGHLEQTGILGIVKDNLRDL